MGRVRLSPVIIPLQWSGMRLNVHAWESASVRIRWRDMKASVYDSLFIGLAFWFWIRKWKAASLAIELFHLDHKLEQNGFVCATRPHLKGAGLWCVIPGARPSSSATSAQLRWDAPCRFCNWAYFIEHCTDSTFMRGMWPSSVLDLSKGLFSQCFSSKRSAPSAIKALSLRGGWQRILFLHIHQQYGSSLL